MTPYPISPTCILILRLSNVQISNVVVSSFQASQLYMFMHFLSIAPVLRTAPSALTGSVWQHSVNDDSKILASAISSCLLFFSLLLNDISALNCGPGSSVGIATDYGLDGPGSNCGRDEIFRPSRPALGPTQPPVIWVPDLYYYAY